GARPGSFNGRWTSAQPAGRDASAGELATLPAERLERGKERQGLAEGEKGRRADVPAPDVGFGCAPEPRPPGQVPGAAAEVLVMPQFPLRLSPQQAHRESAAEAGGMKVVIPGGSGQVGTLLARAFNADGHEVVVLSRCPRHAPWRVVGWDAESVSDWAA